MIIRPATERDLPAILAIENVSFDAPWTDEHFRYELVQNPFAFVFVAVEDDLLLGYIDWWITFEVGQVNNLAVHPNLRGKGIGKTLMEDVLKRFKDAQCERVTLEVRLHNEAAITLYERLGFQKRHLKKNYYENGDDAWAMEFVL
jgi:[ribosomal protein S18]-alanine N-acetyltransferase